MLKCKEEVDVYFKAEDHSYSYVRNGEIIPLKGVTSTISKYHSPFNAKVVALNIVNSKNYSKGKYSGMTVENIVKSWKATGDHGREMHSCIEKILNNEDLTPIEREKYSKELSIYEKFMGEYKPLEIHLSEVNVFSTSLELSGTLDYITFSPDGRAQLLDWKRTPTMDAVSYDGKKMKSPFNDLDDCKVSRYSLQLNVYRELLESNYTINGNPVTVESMKIVSIHPDNDEAIVTDVKRIDIKQLK